MILKNKLNHLTTKTKEGRKNIAPTAKPAEKGSSKTFKRVYNCYLTNIISRKNDKENHGVISCVY